MIGALLGDFAKTKIEGKYYHEIEKEIFIHRKVDTFTDGHPITKTAIEIINPTRRKYGGILIDVFYDHILAKNWASYSTIPLQDFTQRFYKTLLKYSYVLPAKLVEAMPKMMDQDWLCSYKDISRVKSAILRISNRLSGNSHILREGLTDLIENYSSLSSCFHSFFPKLIKFVENARANT